MGVLGGMTTLTTQEPRHRAAHAIRSVAAEISDRSTEHGHARRADESVDWLSQAADQVEGDPARRLAHETTRRIRRPAWGTVLVAVSAVVAVGGVVAWSVGRRRQRSSESQQNESTVES
jgi:hypothetical protein